ncbi:DUF6221 family protein [Streptomyces bacillaris]|uniref:DUF6221 family protein n=1 Tax=Streptomyces bacillaris TaxID=68179 RepID=UPI0035DFCD78
MNHPTTPRLGERIIAFLNSAITAREEAAHGAPRGPWSVRLDDDAIVAPDGITVTEAFALSGQQIRSILNLIALHDATEVLRRCAADRKLIALHHNDGFECPVCAGEPWVDEDSEGNGEWIRSSISAPCPTLLALAEGYGWAEGAR